MHGAKCWTLSQTEEQNLDVFQKTVLRRIYGPIQDGGIWRNRYNFELHKLYTPKFTAAIRSCKMTLGRSRATYGRETDAQQTPYAEISGKRKVVSSKSRWLDEVNEDAKDWGQECGGKER